MIRHPLCPFALVVLLTPAAMAHADVLPAPDLNGYISQNDIPVLGSGDTCRAGHTCIDLPACDQTLHPGQAWTAINWSNRVICLEPGDYRSNGQLDIPGGASADNRRWVRLAGAVPARMSSWTHPRLRTEGQRAVLASIRAQAGNTVVFSLSVRPGPSNNSGVIAPSDVAHDHLLLSHLDLDLGEQAVGDAGATGVDLQGASSDVVLQNTVVGPCLPRYDRDTIQIQLGAGLREVAVVNVETFDCTHGQIGGDRDGFDGATRVVENSDFYLSPDTYASCDVADFRALGLTTGDAIPASALSADGECMCAESAWDLKHGAVTFMHNRFWGFRPAGNNQCGGTGSVGNTIAVLNYGDNVTIEGNWFMDDAGGLALPHLPRSTFPEDRLFEGIVVRNNFVDAWGDMWFQARPTTASGVYWSLLGVLDSAVEGNTIVAEPGTQFMQAGTGYDMAVRCNIFVEGGASTGSPSPIEDNVYIPDGSATYGEGGATIFASTSAAGLTSGRCVYRRLLTDPEVVCYDNIAPGETTALPTVCAIGGTNIDGEPRTDAYPGAFAGGEVIEPRDPVTVVAPYLRVSPIVDGNLIDLGDADDIAVGTGRARFAWDDHDVYLGFDVRDGSIEAAITDPEGQLYRDDSVEWMLDPELDGGGDLPAGDFKTTINTLATFAVRGGSFSYIADSGARVAVNVVSDGYVVEAALPFALIGTPNEGDTWGLELVQNEVDGGARTIEVWSNDDGGSVNNADGWGWLVFGEPWEGPYPDVGGDDTGVDDTGVEDTGLTDTGVDDTGVTDTGLIDTGVDDTRDHDTDLPDAEGDAGTEPDTSTPSDVGEDEPLVDASAEGDTVAESPSSAGSEGCACSATPAAPTAFWPLALVALASWRRRRQG